jgi:hypothetical protein
MQSKVQSNLYAKGTQGSFSMRLPSSADNAHLLRNELHFWLK